MNSVAIRASLPIFCMGLLLAYANTADANKNKPRLVLQITIDALRADLPERFERHYGKDGWRYLLDQGTHYVNAHYEHANTETIVGHTSLATGAYPSTHGMVANVWFDRETDALRYNIEDPKHKLLTAGGGVDKSREIDPTQKTARSDGRSPSAIRVSTFSDQLIAHTAGRAKVFAVSVKDRGAVSMAGHTGKAFWFSKSTGQFVTSDYYYESYPKWVADFNAKKHPARYGNTAWTLSGNKQDYLFADADDKQWETALPGWGRTFPHAYGAADGKYFTMDFAKTLVENEKLGMDEIPDYLAISFSSTDYVNHLFGPSSLEAEENQRRLDRTLAQLFKFIDAKVGLDKTLIVLSADHGSPDTPGYLQALGIESAAYFDTKGLNRQPAIDALKQQFGLGKELIETYYHPYLYLNRGAVKKAGLDQAKVERAVAQEVMKFPGVVLAVPSSALRANRLPDLGPIEAVLRNYDLARSGDIYLVFAPHNFINDFDGLTVAATHGSPWNYDTHVPVIFAGHGIKGGRLSRRITPYDIAPTLSAYLRIGAPSGADGNVLHEVVGY